MNLLIDGYYIDKPRGMGRYLQELLFAVASYAPKYYSISVLIPSDIPDDLLVSPESINYIRKKRFPFPVWEQFLLPFSVIAGRYDVVHFPYNTMPIVMNLPLLRRAFNEVRVVTVHDMIFFETLVGSNFYQGWGNRYRKFNVQRLTNYKTKLLTVSQFSAEEIKSKIAMVAQVIYTPVERTCPVEFGDRTVIEKWVGTQRYLLHIGGVSPHKNSDLCIKAFIAAKLPSWKLMVLGMPTDCRLAQLHADNDAITFPGWVSDHEIRALLGHADGVLFPSLIEGYGLPIVEAFASGIPLLTSDRPPMNELAGNAAILVNPESLEAMTNGILALVSDEANRKLLIERGHLRMSGITSEKMAEKLLAIYGPGK